MEFRGYFMACVCVKPRLRDVKALKINAGVVNALNLVLLKGIVYPKMVFHPFMTDYFVDLDFGDISQSASLFWSF